MRVRLVLAFTCLALGSSCAPSSSSHPGSTATTDPGMMGAAVDQVPATGFLGRLAFVRDGDIWVQDVPGTVAQRVTDDGANERPVWSPSGHWIAFRKRSGTQVDLWVMRSSGTDVRPVTPQGPPLPPAASWSPVEDRMAHTRDGSLWILDPDQWAERQIVPGGSQPEDDRVMRMAWSPDGQWIAYERLNRPELRPVLQGIFRVRPDGRDDAEVFSNPDPLATQSLLAGWSPDGEQILFWEGWSMSASQLAGGPPLMAVRASGGEPLRLSPGVLFRHRADVIAWSRDGAHLAVVEGPGREVWERKAIRVFNSSSWDSAIASEPDRVDFFPSWSPDGERLVYASGPRLPMKWGMGDERERTLGQRRIWTMRPDGSDKRQLTADDRFRDERPLWLGEGAHILFARLAGEQAQLWLMRADGTEQQLLVNDLGPIPNQPSVWFGYYGYIDWSRYYDWWQVRTTVQADAAPHSVIIDHRTRTDAGQ